MGEQPTRLLTAQPIHNLLIATPLAVQMANQGSRGDVFLFGHLRQRGVVLLTFQQPLLYAFT